MLAEIRLPITSKSWMVFFFIVAKIRIIEVVKIVINRYNLTSLVTELSNLRNLASVWMGWFVLQNSLIFPMEFIAESSICKTERKPPNFYNCAQDLLDKFP